MSDNEKVDNVKTMVDSLANGDNIAAQDAFKNALSDKIGSALDDKRMTVANDWLNAAHETEDLEQNSVMSGSQEVEPVEQEPAQEPVEIDNDEEPNEQPDVSEV
jgi:TATA-binding protein-associated factor Taf7|tara:strand:+ start:588 stop:899 length:312 start_codon:yes stop_codon:yes gene_type:complete